jgi:hypothetical protein
MRTLLRRIVLIGALALAVAAPFVGVVLTGAAHEATGQTDPLVDLFTIGIGVLGITAVGVGAVILWRRPGNLIGVLLVVGALLATGMSIAWPIAVYRTAVAGEHDILAIVAIWFGLNAILIGVFVLFPAVGIFFPDGRLPSPRWRLPFAAVVGMLVVATILQTISPWPPEMGVVNPLALPGLTPDVGALGGGLAALAVFIAAAMAVVAVATRFRRSVGVERAQLKWFVASVSLTAVLFPLSFATDVGPAYLIDVASVVAACLIPVAVGIAILRYRLYDFDRVVSRTIAYGLVTAILLLTYWVAILLLQEPLASVTGNENVLVVLSTLLVAGLFQPVRRRVQTVVDRRFDRARFDADRTALAFSDRLRDETDIATVAADLDGTIREALKPTTMDLWLRKSAG